MRLVGLLLLLDAVWAQDGTYTQRAIAEANKHATTKGVLSLFRAAAHLDGYAKTGFDVWNNIGVSLLRAAKDEVPPMMGAASSHAIWAAASFELAKRLDPLGRLKVIDENLEILKAQEPEVATLLANRPRGYWRAGPLMPTTSVGEISLVHAKAGREDEALLFLWQGLQDLDRRSPSTWLNFGIMMNKARKWVQHDPKQFYNATAIALAAVEHALDMYMKDGTPRNKDGLPPPIAENQMVLDSLRKQAAGDPHKLAHAMYAKRVVHQGHWPILKSDRWQLRRSLSAGAPLDLGGDALGPTELIAHVLGLFSEAVLLMRVYGPRNPRLKRSALALIRAAVEAAGLMPAVHAAERGAGTAAINTAIEDCTDRALANPLLTVTYGLIASAARHDAVAGAASDAAELRAEALAAYRLTEVIAPGDETARVGRADLARDKASDEARIAKAEKEHAVARGSRGGASSGADDDTVWDPAHVGGTSALHARLREYLAMQRRATSWLAGDDDSDLHKLLDLPQDEREWTPRVLVYELPNVGLGNQVIGVVSALAHAILTDRALLVHAPDLQCSDEENGDDGEGVQSHNALLCEAFDFVGEDGGERPLWRLVEVVERSRSSARLQRLYWLMGGNTAAGAGKAKGSVAAGAEKAKGGGTEKAKGASAPSSYRAYNLRPLPGRTPAVEALTCAADEPPRDRTFAVGEAIAADVAEGGGPRMLAIKTPLWYVPLLELNANFKDEISRLFAPIDPYVDGVDGTISVEPLYDVFGPLLRFLLRPRPPIQKAAAAFIDTLVPPGGARAATELIALHVRVQDSTHDTHAERGGPASYARLERAAKRCAANRLANVTKTAPEGAAPRVAVLVASDHASLRERLVRELRGSAGVSAASFYQADKGAFNGDAASRKSASGFRTAAIELLTLGHATQLIQAGNNGFSSFGMTAAHMLPHPTVTHMLNHPCDEMWRTQAGEADCILQEHPQPWLNLRWYVADTHAERKRVSCALMDTHGVQQPLVHRLQARGAMELICPEVHMMARRQGLFGKRGRKDEL